MFLINLFSIDMVKVNNISFSYDGNLDVLKDISFESHNMDTIAIVGPSGCGKSTLLRLIAGVLQAQSIGVVKGSITINNLSSKDWLRKGKTGFMFQEPTLLPNLSVKENIELPLKILKKNYDTNELDDIIKTVGLTEYIDYLPNRLSGGMKTRVALARTFITKPELLLLDEPFGSLDVQRKFSLYRELELLRKSFNPQVIIVTHDINEALLLSNHILVINSKNSLAKEYIIEKPLPRVFKLDSIKELQNEYYSIQQIIMND